MTDKDSRTFELVSIFKDTPIVQLCGPFTIELSTEFDKLGKELKSIKSSVAADARKVTKDVQYAAQCISPCVHLARRVLILQELESLTNTFKSLPALIAPRILNVLGALSYANAELKYYFFMLVHRRSDAAFVEQELDPNVPEIIYYVLKLMELLRVHTKIIEQYYREFLFTTDMNALTESGAFKVSIQKMVKSGKDFESAVSGINKVMSKAYREFNGTAAAIPRNYFAGLRESIKKVEAASALATSALQQNAVKDFLHFLRILSLHTMLLDSFEELTASYGSLSWAWHCREEVFSVFANYLKGHTTRSQPSCFSVYFSVLSQAELDIDDATDHDEAKEVLSGMRRYAGRYLTEFETHIKEVLTDIVAKYLELGRQVAPDTVLARLRQLRGANTKPGQRQPQVLKEYPGSESLPNVAVSATVAQLRELMLRIHKLMHGLCSFERFVVGGKEYNLQEEFREMFRSWLASYLRQLFKCSDGAIVRPTVALSELREVYSAVHLLETNGAINLDEVWRKTLLQEFQLTACGAVDEQDPIDEETLALIKETCIGNVIKFFVNFLEFHADGVNVVYSPTKHSFVSRPQYAFKAQHFTDINELRALATILGPIGIKILISGILNSTMKNVSKMKSYIESNSEKLKEVKRNHLSGDSLKVTLASIKDINAFVCYALNVGSAFALRHLLVEALHCVATAKTPMLLAAVENVSMECPANYAMDAEYLPMDAIAAHLGVEALGTEQDIKLALKRVVTAKDKAWKLLPTMLAVLFTSERFKAAQFIPYLNAFQNSIHVLFFTMNEFLAAVTLITKEEGKPKTYSAGEFPKSVVKAQRELVQSAVSIIYHTYKTTTKEKTTVLSDIHALFIFMDNFLEHGTMLQRGDLESCLPYTLLREAFREELRPEKVLPEGW